MNTERHEFLRTRRSVRRFKPDPVPAPVIDRIMATATYAPSAHNLQPWRFVRLQSAEAKTRLGEALTTKMRADMSAEGAPEAETMLRVERSLRRIDEAPVIIVFCRDASAVRVDTPEEMIMGIQSVAMAGLQLLLAAQAEGLGGNWICWPLYAQEETRQALHLPATWEPQGMLFLGYAEEDGKPKDKKLRPLEEILMVK